MTSTPGNYTPIHNPYIVGNPIKDSKMFFGREEDFAYVKSKLTGSEQGGLVVLSGARRSGKTSILFQILQGRLGEEFVPVLIDMQSMAITDSADFLSKVARAIVSSEFAASFSSIAPFVIDNPDDPYSAFEEFIVRVTGSLGGRSLVLTFDEYELFETNIDSGVLSERILHMLSGIIEHHDVFVVFTGSDKLEQRNRPYWDIFLSKAQQKRVSFLHVRDTMRLITQPVAGEVEYDDDVPERIVALTAGQPFYTQVLCRSIVAHLNDGRKRVAGAEDLEDVVQEVVENPLPQMIFHWNALAPAERLALSIVAEIRRSREGPVSADDICQFAERENIGYRFEKAVLNKALETLFHGDLMVKEPDSDRYEFKMGLWLRWVTRMHSVWQVVDEIEQEGPLPEDGGLSPSKKRRGRLGMAIASLIIVVLAVFGYRALNRQGAGERASSIAPVDSATLAVTTRPPQATIFVDDRALGLSPLTRRVPAGSLMVSAVLPQYRTGLHQVLLEVDDRRDVEIALVPLTGRLRVTSDPPGAAIVVDGVDTGLRTPSDIEDLTVIEPHDVQLRLESFRPGTRSAVRVFADSTVSLRHDFSKRTAVASVFSTPQGAAVYIDDQEAGATPLTFPGVTYGAHAVRLNAPGYADTSVSVDVANSDVRIEVALRKLPPGVVQVQIPFGGDIVVDGRLVQERVEYWPLRLDAGQHSIVVTNRTGKSKTEVVAVVSGDTTVVRFEFN
jgi:ribosomal protein S28E/S33